MRRVQILSPFRGATPADQRRNVAYAQAALLDSLGRDEAPFAPHLLYPAVLDDSEPEQRAQGISAGLEWLAVAEAVAAYTDLGISAGMAAELRAAEAAGIPVERRSLAGWRLRTSADDRLAAAPRARRGDTIYNRKLSPVLSLAVAAMVESRLRRFVGRWATAEKLPALAQLIMLEIKHERPDLTLTVTMNTPGVVSASWKYKLRSTR